MVGSLSLGLFVLAQTPLAPPAPPAPPAQVQLVWDDRVNTTQDGYLVQRREQSPPGAYRTLASTDAQARTYTDRAVVKNQRVCYVVRAFRNAGAQVSVPSNEVCVRVG